MNSTKKNILIVCPYPFGVAPSQRLKFEQYYSYFEQNGYNITIKPFIDDAFWKIVHKPGNAVQKFLKSAQGYVKRALLLFSLRKYDIVYIHLWVTPFGLPFFEWLYTSIAKKTIYDIDDLVYLKFDKTPWFIRQLKGYKKPVLLMKKSNHVITCTPHLDQFVQKYNTHTTDISSTINTRLYRPKLSYDFMEAKPVIGWSGSYSTVWHMQTVFEALKALRKQIDFKLLVMGTEDLVDDDLDIECIAWKEEYEVDVIGRFDIGIYPLPDREFVLGKSSLKALQYMAKGIPTVATAIGTNFRVIEHNVSGVLVNTDQEWVDALTELINNKAKRKYLGENAAERVETLFSVNANKDKYLQILDSLA